MARGSPRSWPSIHTRTIQRSHTQPHLPQVYPQTVSSIHSSIPNLAPANPNPRRLAAQPSPLGPHRRCHPPSSLRSRASANPSCWRRPPPWPWLLRPGRPVPLLQEAAARFPDAVPPRLHTWGRPDPTSSCPLRCPSPPTPHPPPPCIPCNVRFMLNVSPVEWRACFHACPCPLE